MAWTQVMMKHRNEPHHEDVELEVKGVGGVRVKINHFAKDKIISHSKLSSVSTTDSGSMVSFAQGKTQRTTGNLKCKL